MSNLSEDELDDLKRRIIDVVCRERPSWWDPLESSVLYDMLTEEGFELPGFAMSDALQGLRGIVNIKLGGPQNPHTDPEARAHGGVSITGIDPDFCEA